MLKSVKLRIHNAQLESLNVGLHCCYQINPLRADYPYRRQMVRTAQFIRFFIKEAVKDA